MVPVATGSSREYERATTRQRVFVVGLGMVGIGTQTLFFSAQLLLFVGLLFSDSGYGGSSASGEQDRAYPA